MQLCEKAGGTQTPGPPGLRRAQSYILCSGYWFSSPVIFSLKEIAVTKTNRLSRQIFPCCSLPNGLDSDFLQPTSDVQPPNHLPAKSTHPASHAGESSHVTTLPPGSALISPAVLCSWQLGMPSWHRISLSFQLKRMLKAVRSGAAPPWAQPGSCFPYIITGALS